MNKAENAIPHPAVSPANNYDPPSPLVDYPRQHQPHWRKAWFKMLTTEWTFGTTSFMTKGKTVSLAGTMSVLFGNSAVITAKKFSVCTIKLSKRQPIFTFPTLPQNCPPGLFMWIWQSKVASHIACLLAPDPSNLGHFSPVFFCRSMFHKMYIINLL